MRALILIAGMVCASAASAGDPAHDESDAVSGQLVYQMSFGGERSSSAGTQSFQLQFASEWQRQAGFVPLRAEFRTDTQQFLVNGVDVGRTLMLRQAEEGGLSSLSGWVPMLIVLSAASFILIDGQDLGEDEDGTGSF